MFSLCFRVGRGPGPSTGWVGLDSRSSFEVLDGLGWIEILCTGPLSKD